jgi:acyl carrier protein
MDEAGAAELVRHALVDALALDAAPESLRGDQPLFEPPIRMDSLGFHRVIVELEIRHEARLDEQLLERTLFETVDDLVRFVSEQFN